MTISISSQINRVLLEYPNLRAPSAEMQKCASIAKSYFSYAPQGLVVKRIFSSSVRSLLVALERFLMKLGLLHLFQKVVSPEEIDAKGQDMILLSSIFSTLTTTIIPVLGPYHGGMLIGGIFLTLLSFSITYPLWRPFPSYLPRVENWTEKYESGQLEVGLERKDIVEKLARCLKTSPVMIIGKEGVGKTEIVKSFVQNIHQRKYPEFEGSKVFYLNTADLIHNTDWLPNAHSPISYLSQAIDGHRHQMIFVFDEIHLAHRFKETICAQIKTTLDSPKTTFPKFIAISDIEEYKQLTPGFKQRFRIIHLNQPSRDEIVRILEAKLFPDIIADRDALHRIAENSQNLNEAIYLLKKCMEKVSIHFKEERKMLEDMKKQMYRSSLNKDEEKVFAALHQILIPQLEQRLIQKAKESGFEIVLSLKIVDQVVLEENSTL
jgi:GTPase SAR1 family protein